MWIPWHWPWLLHLKMVSQVTLAMDSLCNKLALSILFCSWFTSSDDIHSDRLNLWPSSFTLKRRYKLTFTFSFSTFIANDTLRAPYFHQLRSLDSMDAMERFLSEHTRFYDTDLWPQYWCMNTHDMGESPINLELFRLIVLELGTGLDRQMNREGAMHNAASQREAP